MDQLSILPGIDPDDLVAEAKREHAPIETVCLFSGGNDSTVLAHRCREHYDRLVFIDTGTAVPGVREFVESFAEWIGKPLTVHEAGDAFRRMVLGDTGPAFGFPGPAQHGRAYTRIKERQLEAMLREAKAGHPRSARVLALTGVRRSESARRASRTPITRRFSLVFANPLIDWTNTAMRRYRVEYELPESDVAALIHRSGECNCGAFAEPGEREMLAALWPEWFEATIASLEREAEAAGIPACRWGERPPDATPADAGPLCSSCEFRQMDLRL
jgi:3'-phosphoadenosine 5'-phosphosulfate sulfotransferase (PAPS reductase)/FAD synthetase